MKLFDQIRMVHALRMALWLPMFLICSQTLYAQAYREAAPEKLQTVTLEANSSSPLSADGVVSETVISSKGATYLRLLLDVNLDSDENIVITFRNGNGRVLSLVPAARLVSGQRYITGPLAGDKVIVQIEGRPKQAVKVSIVGLLKGTDTVGKLAPQSIVPEWISIERAPQTPFKNIKGDIAKLYIGEGWTCTAFAIEPNLLVTAKHCIALALNYREEPGSGEIQKTACEDINAQFDFNSEVMRSSPVFPCESAYSFRAIGQLESADIAIIQLAEKGMPVGARRSTALRMASNDFQGKEYMEVNVIHHPMGLAKKVSLFCKLYPTYEHECGTTSGSSGAPLINSRGEVMAIHTGGSIPLKITIEELYSRIQSGERFLNKSIDVAQVKRLVEAMRRTQ